MTDKPAKLSITARALLAFAATRDNHLILHPRLPIAAARQVARSLLGLELAEEVLASGKAADLAWPVGDGGGALVLRATAVGLARIAVGAETTAAAVTTAHLADPGGGALLQGVAAHVWRPWAARLYRLYYPRAQLGRGFAAVALSAAHRGGTDPLHRPLALAVSGERAARAAGRSVVHRRRANASDAVSIEFTFR
jgi:hypothetical protein